MDVATLAQLLHETAEHHDAFEKRAPKHDWWDWYAAYLDARLRGIQSEEASSAADRYMAEVRHVVAPAAGQRVASPDAGDHPSSSEAVEMAAQVAEEDAASSTNRSQKGSSA